MKSQCLGIKWFRAIVDTFSEDNTAAVVHCRQELTYIGIKKKNKYFAISIA